MSLLAQTPFAWLSDTKTTWIKDEEKERRKSEDRLSQTARESRAIFSFSWGQSHTEYTFLKVTIGSGSMAVRGMNHAASHVNKEKSERRVWEEIVSFAPCSLFCVPESWSRMNDRMFLIADGVICLPFFAIYYFPLSHKSDQLIEQRVNCLSPSLPSLLISFPFVFQWTSACVSRVRCWETCYGSYFLWKERMQKGGKEEEQKSKRVFWEEIVGYTRQRIRERVVGLGLYVNLVEERGLSIFAACVFLLFPAAASDWVCLCVCVCVWTGTHCMGDEWMERHFCCDINVRWAFFLNNRQNLKILKGVTRHTVSHEKGWREERMWVEQ